MSYHFVFKSGSVMNFKYCPYCGEEIMQVYPGDFNGFVQCIECEECEERLEFDILEEMIERHPKWLIDIITEPYKKEISKLRDWNRGEKGDGKKV